MLSLNFTKFQSIYPQITEKNTHNVQIAPSHKHSIGMSEAQKINFAKHNEAHKNLGHDLISDLFTQI